MEGAGVPEAPATPVASALGIRGVEVVPGATGMRGTLEALTWGTAVELQ
jgi:hypothetical protein